MASSGNVVRIIVAADVADALRGLTSVQNAAGGVGRAAAGAAESTQSAWAKLKESVAGQVALGGLIEKSVSGAFGMVVDGAKQMVAAGLDYESSMNTLSAVTKASGTQMDALGAKAKALGNDITIPGASAGEAAAAMAELAKGGLSVDETMAAATGTLRLATAAQVSGAEAATIQANALNAFRLSADQADHVADLLANSANAASGEVTDMAAALAQSATVAAGFGISVDDSATTLALFAKNGVLGSDAGTSFKTMLSALASPTEAQSKALDALNLSVYDAQGNFVGMESVTRQLAEAKKNLTVEEYNAAASTAFGTDAIRAANILGQEGTKGWQDMATAVGQAGGAQELAAAQSQGFTGALDRFNNAASTAALTLYEELAPGLTSVADFGAAAFSWIGDAIGWFADLDAPVRNAAIALGAVVLLHGPLTAIGPAISRMVGLAVLNFNALVVGIRAGTVSMATFGTVAKGALGLLGGPLGLAIIGATTALTLFSGGSDDATVSTEGLTAAVDEQTGALRGNAAEIIASEAANSGAAAAYERIGGTVSDYVDALAGVPGAQEKVNAKIAEGRAAYDAQQQAVEGATQGTGNFGAAMGSATSAAGAAIPSIQDLNSATSYLSTAQGTLAGETDKVRLKNAGLAGELGDTASATTDAGDAAEDAANQATPFGDALKDIRGAASEADAATQFLTISLLEMSGGTVTADQRARAHAAAMREVGGSARDLAEAQQDATDKQAEADNIAAHLGTTLDGQAVSATNLAITQADVDRATRAAADAADKATAAEEAQKDALDKAAQSSRDMTAEAYNGKAAQGDLRGGIEAAVAKMIEQRDQFIKSAVDAGVSEQAAKDLADQQGLIPENVRTTYEQIAVDAAIQKAEDLNRKLSDLDKKEIYYKVVGTEVQKFVTGSYAPEDLHAEGGYISGPGTGTSDSIRARLSNGEFVVRASQTAKHRDVLEAINTPGFADGGLVSNKHTGDFSKSDLGKGFGPMVDGFIGKIREAMASFGSNGQWGAANPQGLASNTAAARDFIMQRWGITNIGGWRASGSVPGSDHPMGKALDVMIANYKQPAGIAQGNSVADWFIQNPNSFGTKYVIWRDRINQKGAWSPYSHPGGNDDNLAHRNHVHLSFLTGGGQFGAAAGGGGAAGGSGVERWRGLGLDVLSQVGAYRGMNLTGSIDRMLNQIRTESSGNPNAINRTDINAQRGDPSIGLLQVIGSTFRNALRGTPFEGLIGAGQYDPRASLTASTLYSLNRYGSLDRAWRGVAYDNGGALPPGFTMAYNGTGKTEHVFTHDQMVKGMSAPSNIQVFIGERELTEIVDVRVDGQFYSAAARVPSVMAMS